MTKTRNREMWNRRRAVRLVLAGEFALGRTLDCRVRRAGRVGRQGDLGLVQPGQHRGGTGQVDALLHQPPRQRAVHGAGVEITQAEFGGHPPGGSGFTGPRRTVDRDDQAEVYACGPPPMLEAVRALCAEREVPAQLALESGMACGFGACFGCVVPTRAGFVRLCLEHLEIGVERECALARPPAVDRGLADPARLRHSLDAHAVEPDRPQQLTGRGENGVAARLAARPAARRCRVRVHAAT